MKLYYAGASPFARKVRVVLAEKGCDCEMVAANPWDEPEALTAINPVSQVPALVRDDGSALYDSTVIVHWLDEQAGPRLIPEGEEGWRVRRLEATCNAVCDDVVKLRQEEMRPEEQRSDYHAGRWRRAVTRALDALEADGAGGGVDLGELMLVVTLEYIDLRAPYLNWRDGRPNLVARWARIKDRPSLAATRPA
jgi:glutathione S-transferase